MANYNFKKQRFAINKTKKINIKNQLLETAKKDPVYQNVMEIFSDAELIDIQDDGKTMDDFKKILDKAKELEIKMKESQSKIRDIKVEGVSEITQLK